MWQSKVLAHSVPLAGFAKFAFGEIGLLALAGGIFAFAKILELLTAESKQVWKFVAEQCNADAAKSSYDRLLAEGNE